MSAIAGSQSGTSDTPVTMSVDLVTDPLGVELTAEVSPQLPDPAADALLEDVQTTLAEARNSLIFQSIRVAHGTLRSYASRNDYAMEPIIESVELLTSETRGRTYHARWGWTHEAAPFFNFGVSPHTINGNPLLHFYWEEIGQWIQTESVEWGSRTGGIPESRYVHAGMNWLRQEVT